MRDFRDDDVFDQRSYTYKEFAVLVTEKLKELEKFKKKLEEKVDEHDTILVKYEAWRTGTSWLIATLIAIIGLIIAYLAIV